jgi:hypothetical protein
MRAIICAFRETPFWVHLASTVIMLALMAFAWEHRHDPHPLSPPPAVEGRDA